MPLPIAQVAALAGSSSWSRFTAHLRFAVGADETHCCHGDCESEQTSQDNPPPRPVSAQQPEGEERSSTSHTQSEQPVSSASGINPLRVGPRWLRALSGSLRRGQTIAAEPGAASQRFRRRNQREASVGVRHALMGESTRHAAATLPPTKTPTITTYIKTTVGALL